jgi:hypothetical protein
MCRVKKTCHFKSLPTLSREFTTYFLAIKQQSSRYTWRSFTDVSTEPSGTFEAAAADRFAEAELHRFGQLVAVVPGVASGPVDAFGQQRQLNGQSEPDERHFRIRLHGDAHPLLDVVVDVVIVVQSKQIVDPQPFAVPVPVGRVLRRPVGRIQRFVNYGATFRQIFRLPL